MQLLDRLPAVAKLGSQPVEQFGMRRLLAHPSKVAGCCNDATAEVVLPDAIDNAAPSERVIAPS